MMIMNDQTTVEAMSLPLEKEKRPCIFYKLIVASILQDRKLRIPAKFVQKFGDELSSVAKLTIPSGRIWLVELRKHNHKLWFDNGWHEFTEHCSIHAGYFLIFRYQGNSNFNVYIFDLATSEIDYPRNTFNSLQEPDHGKQQPLPIEKDEEKNNFLEILPSHGPFPALGSLTKKVLDEGVYYKWNKNFTSGVKLEYMNLGDGDGKPWHVPIEKDKEKNNSLVISPSRAPSPALCSLTRKVLDEGVSCRWNESFTSKVKLEYVHLGGEVHNQQAACQSPQDKAIQLKSKFTNKLDEVGLYFNCGTKRKISWPGEVTDSCKRELEEEFPAVEVSFKTYSRRSRPVTLEEKKRTVDAAEMFKSNNPFFRVILRPSYVYRALLLHIPSNFARMYLNGFRGNIKLLDTNGKQWLVRCVGQSGKAKLSKGWPAFVWEHNLDVSDICVFELINTNDFTFKVTIFRVLEDAAPARQPSEQRYLEYGHLFRVVDQRTASKSSLKMIPEKFTRKVRDKLSHVATLTVPDGRDWRVRLTKNTKRMIWFEEVEDEEQKLANGGGEMESEKSVEILGSKATDQTFSTFKRKKFGDSTKLKTVIHNEKNENPTGIVGNGSKLKKGKYEVGRHSSEDDEVVIKIADEHELWVLHKKKEIFIREDVDGFHWNKDRLFLAARLFKPGYPAFLSILKSLTYGNYTCVPAKFANKYFDGDSKSIKLQDTDGKEWTVQLGITRRKFQKLCVIKVGWPRFMRDKNLKKRNCMRIRADQNKGCYLKSFSLLTKGDSHINLFRANYVV